MTILAYGSVLAIVRFRGAGDVVGTPAALGAGGVRLLEAGVDRPGALRAVRPPADARRTIGVGTVTTPDEVRASRDAGASFVVSPACLPDVIETALRVGVEPIPGVLTATELMLARRSGATAIKVFP